MSSSSAEAADAWTARARHRVVNLASDLPGLARFANPDLVNAWGIAKTKTRIHGKRRTLFYVAANGTGKVVPLNERGRQVMPSIVVPPPQTQMTTVTSTTTTISTPTGIVLNRFCDSFLVNGRAAEFIVVTEDGTISAFNRRVNAAAAILQVDNSQAHGPNGLAMGAVYKAVTIALVRGRPHLFVANFRDAVIEVYNDRFQFVRFFTDPSLQADASAPGFAPFGLQVLADNTLAVAFALQDSKRHDNVSGPSLGFIDIFKSSGRLLRRLLSGGPLNAPWGLQQRDDWLFVGNFGDGKINAVSLCTSHVMKHKQFAVLGLNGQPIDVDGLWGLQFLCDDLYLAAGINGENNGLFARIQGALDEVEEEEQPESEESCSSQKPTSKGC